MDFKDAAVQFLKVARYSHKPESREDFLKLPRPFYALAFMEQGTATFVSGEQSLTLHPGECLLIPRGTVYQSFWHGDLPLHLTCHFGFVSNAPFADRDIPMQILCDAPLGELTEQLYAAKDSEMLSKLAVFYTLCARLYDVMQYTPKPQPDPRLAPAFSFLQSVRGDTVSVEMLARLCHMSPSYFYACFHRATGSSPIVYKQSLAVQHATQLLCDPSLSVELIAEMAGFASSSYFRRVFRHFMCQSPRDYRRALLEALSPSAAAQ